MARIDSNRTVNSVRNSLTGFLQKIVGLLLPFAVRTVLIKKLGIEYLGLNSLFASILQVLSLSELGFAAAIIFNLYKPIAEDDKDKICALLNAIKKIYRIVGLVILVAGLAIMPFIKYLISGGYPADVNLYILYAIFLLNTVISYFLYAHLGVVLNAYQRSDIENIVFLICNTILYGLQIVVLFVFPNYYLYIALLPLSTIALNVIRAIIVRKKYPDLKEKGKLDAETKKEIPKQIKAIIGHKLSGIIISSTDSIFISAFLGLQILAIYNNYFYIVSAIMAIVNILYSSITPSVGNSIISSDSEKMYKLFNNINFVNVWITGWCSICMFCLYQHFMQIWVGTEFMFSLLTVALLVIYFYTWKFREILNVYKDATGNWKIDFWRPYVVAVLNIALDFLLIHYIGVNGVLVATIVSFPVLSFPWEVAVSFKHIFKRSAKGYCLKMLLYSIAVVASGAATYFVCELLPSAGVGYFIAKCAICFTLPNLIFVAASFYLPEFKYASSKLKFLLSRFKRNKVVEETKTPTNE